MIDGATIMAVKLGKLIKNSRSSSDISMGCTNLQSLGLATGRALTTIDSTLLLAIHGILKRSHRNMSEYMI